MHLHRGTCTQNWGGGNPSVQVHSAVLVYTILVISCEVLVGVGGRGSPESNSKRSLKRRHNPQNVWGTRARTLQSPCACISWLLSSTDLDSWGVSQQGAGLFLMPSILTTLEGEDFLREEAVLGLCSWPWNRGREHHRDLISFYYPSEC